MNEQTSRRLAGGAVAVMSALSLIGPGIAVAASGPDGAGNPVLNAEANLKDAQTLVESYANGKNGIYPAAASATTLARALKGDGDARDLRGVYYRSGGGRADTYTISAYARRATYWISVVGGVTYYGETRSTKLEAPAPGDRHASTSQWPN